MEQWSADFGNDPYDDYNIVVEILHKDNDVAIIKQGVEGLEIKWYPNTEELIIPVDWLMGLLVEAKKRMSNEL